MKIPFKSISWNLLGGAWIGILVILLTPFYISKVGLAGYGVIAIWTTLQMLMMLFDFGFGASLSKEMSSLGVSRSDIQQKKDILKTIEIVIWFVGLFIASTAIISGVLGKECLDSRSTLEGFDNLILISMVVALAIQFPYSLYFNGLIGLQQHKKVNILHILGNTLRYGCGALILAFTSDLLWFFIAQIIVSVIVTCSIRITIWQFLSAGNTSPPKFSRRCLAKVWTFSAGMAMTSIIAILVSNVDRFALSVLVSLEEFGKYSVAVTATSILQMAIQPIHRVFFPRYVAAVASKDLALIREEYYLSCRAISIILIPMAFVGALFSPEIFAVWLGSHDSEIEFVFKLLLIGVSMGALMWLPAAFQQANGITTIHSALMGGALVVGIPIMLFAVEVYGISGGAVVWLSHGLIEITFGLWMMHRYFFKGEAMSWLFNTVLSPMIPSAIFVSASRFLMPDQMSKLAQLFWLSCTFGLAMIGSGVVVFYLLKDRKIFN